MKITKALSLVKSLNKLNNIKDSKVVDSPASEIVSEIKRTYPQVKITQYSREKSIQGQPYHSVQLIFKNYPGEGATGFGNDPRTKERDGWERFLKHLYTKHTGRNDATFGVSADGLSLIDSKAYDESENTHVADAETIKIKNRSGYEYDIKVSDYCVVKFPFACMAKSKEEKTDRHYPVKIEGWYSSGRKLSGELVTTIKDLYEYSGAVWYGTTSSEEFKKAHYGDTFFTCHPTEIKDLNSHWRKATKEEVKRYYQDKGYTVLDSTTHDELDDADIDDLIAEEYEAIADYEAALTQCENATAKERLTHIMEEEKEHVRELEELKAKQEPITDGVSPQTYIKLKAKGYTHKDWEKWSDEEKVAHSQGEKEEGEKSSKKEEESKEGGKEKQTLSEDEEKFIKKELIKIRPSVGKGVEDELFIPTNSKEKASKVVELLKKKGYKAITVSDPYDGVGVRTLSYDEFKKQSSANKAKQIMTKYLQYKETMEWAANYYANLLTDEDKKKIIEYSKTLPSKPTDY